MRKSTTDWAGVSVAYADAVRKRQLHRLLLRGSIAITTAILLVSLGTTLVSKQTPSVAVLIPPFFLLVVALTCVWLERQGRTITSIRLHLAATALAITVSVALIDGFRSNAMLLFLWPIVLAGAVVKPKLAFAAGLYASLVGVSALVLESVGLYTPLITTRSAVHSSVSLMFNIINYNVLALLIALCLGRLGRTLQQERNLPTDSPGSHSAQRQHASDLVQVRESLQESEERYRMLVDNQGEGIGIVDTEECFTFANPAAHEMFGVPKGDLVGRSLREFVDSQTFSQIRTQTELRRARKKSIYEIVIAHPGAEKRNLLVTATPRVDSDGEFVGTFGIFRDITERKRMEQALRQAHDELESRVRERTSQLAGANEALQIAIAEHQLSQETLERQARNLSRTSAFTSMLGEVSARAGSFLDTHQIMETVGAELKKLGLDCLIATVHGDRQTATIRYDSLDSKVLALGERLVGLKLHETPIPRENWGQYASRFFDHGRPLFVPRMIESTAVIFGHVPRSLLERALRLVGVSADDPIAYLPMMARGQLLGVLAVWGPGLAEEELPVLSVFAGQIAETLESARLYEAERQLATELTRSNAFLTSLSRVGARIQSVPGPDQVFGTLGTELKNLGLDCIVITARQDGEFSLRYISLRPGLMAIGEKLLGVQAIGYRVSQDRLPPEVMEQARPVVHGSPFPLMSRAMPHVPKQVIRRLIELGGISPDDIVIYLPLVVEDRLLGIIGVWGEGLVEENVPALSVFAGQVAVAMENARLYSAEREKSAELARTGEHLKASLQEKELLLQEIHHRVKNNLQVVTSLLSLQSTHIEDEQVLDMFMESQNRVRSMALVHEKLYRSADLARVDFGEYTRSLAAQLLRTYRSSSPGAVTLQVDAEQISLGIDAAVPCGLLLNELVSNALKHAFPDGREGDIRVSMRGKGDEYALEVSDNGVGFPADIDFRNTESLGLLLVTMLVDQLKGNIELDTSKGTTFRITF